MAELLETFVSVVYFTQILHPCLNFWDTICSSWLMTFTFRLGCQHRDIRLLWTFKNSNLCCILCDWTSHLTSGILFAEAHGEADAGKGQGGRVAVERGIRGYGAAEEETEVGPGRGDGCRQPAHSQEEDWRSIHTLPGHLVRDARQSIGRRHAGLGADPWHGAPLGWDSGARLCGQHDSR